MWIAFKIKKIEIRNASLYYLIEIEQETIKKRKKLIN